MPYIVRKAVHEELETILSIYAVAREFMAQTGNPNQWGKTNPPKEQVVRDIAEGTLYVIVSDSIHGVFYFALGEDPTYAVIEEGSWGSDAPYGTIHRIAGDGSGGIVATSVAFAKQTTRHIRIDTHHDNKVMQHVLEKQGFTRRGIIHIADGSPRIAYEMI